VLFFYFLEQLAQLSALVAEATNWAELVATFQSQMRSIAISYRLTAEEGADPHRRRGYAFFSYQRIREPIG
jgi:hypothetical protein